MQELGWFLCEIEPGRILKMTLYELDIVLEQGYRKYKESVRWHVDLLNAPRFHRKDGKPWLYSQFIKESYENTELSEDDQALRVLEKGTKLAAKSEFYKNRMRQRHGTSG